MWLERSGYEYQLFPWPAEGFGKLFHLLRSSASPFLKCKSRSRKKPPISKGGHEYGKKETTRVWSPAGAWPRATLTVLATCPIHVYSWSYVMLIPMGLPNSAQGKTLLRSWHQYLFLEGSTSGPRPSLSCVVASVCHSGEIWVGTLWVQRIWMQVLVNTCIKTAKQRDRLAWAAGIMAGTTLVAQSHLVTESESDF